MLQVARLAPRVLGEAADRVQTFFAEQINDDGGGRDRAGDSDLYYTVFALEGLLAFQAELPVDRVVAFLTAHEDGQGLDLVHLACLARCWSTLPPGSLEPDLATALAARLGAFRNADGGYGPEPDATRATVYHTFLGFAAGQDLGRSCEDPEALANCITARRSSDGGFANLPGQEFGSTTVTAAAVTALRNLGRVVDPEVGPWLVARCDPEGGFRAAPLTPMPDLLSTATALHALAGLQFDFAHLREPCLDFVDTLWTGRAFCGHWADDVLDSEYTYYALLALGHLSL